MSCEAANAFRSKTGYDKKKDFIIILLLTIDLLYYYSNIPLRYTTVLH
ncbi:mobile element protein [Xanthomonas phage vB_XooS_NR08]|nr:mobile element protein [Xanthomonas phage vB_XooS_NR08]